MAKDKEDAPVEEEVAAEEVQEEAGTEASADAPQAAPPQRVAVQVDDSDAKAPTRISAE